MMIIKIKISSALQFQALSVAHSILSDADKRKAYDKNGFLEDEEESSKDYDFWYEYFRNLFPTVTIGDIEKFSTTYKGSAEESADVQKEYIKHKGDFAKIMESVMLAEEGDEERIAKIIDTAIEEGKIKDLPKYRSSLEKALKPKSKKRKSAGGKSTDEVNDLVSAIQSKRRGPSSSSSAMSAILSKYGGAEAEEPQIPDEVFAANRAKITRKKK